MARLRAKRLGPDRVREICTQASRAAAIVRTQRAQERKAAEAAEAEAVSA
jgi:hypothetical protein